MSSESSSSTVPPPAAFEELKDAMEWLASLANEPAVKHDIASWRELMKLNHACRGDCIGDNTRGLPSSLLTIENASGAVDLLATCGLHLVTIARMLHFSPFSSALGAIGELCQVAKSVQSNKLNCTRVLRRAIALVPVLVAVFERVTSDRDCILSASILSTIDDMGGVVGQLTAEVKDYFESWPLTRAFNATGFKRTVDDLQAELHCQMIVLQTALLADQSRQLAALLRHSSSIRVAADEKVDMAALFPFGEGAGVKDTSGWTSASAVMPKSGPQERSCQAAFGSQGAKEAQPSRPHLHDERDVRVVHHMLSVEEVETMLLEGTTNRVFVRDRSGAGKRPVENGGPEGHHYSCAFVLSDKRVYAFHFTRRADGKFVFDRNHTPLRNRDGKIEISMDTPSLPYDPTQPGYDSMMNLLVDVHEVCQMSGFTHPEIYQ